MRMVNACQLAAAAIVDRIVEIDPMNGIADQHQDNVNRMNSHAAPDNVFPVTGSAIVASIAAMVQMKRNVVSIDPICK